MKKVAWMPQRCLPLTLLLGGFAFGAKADSDGYFCAGTNYLVFDQLSSSATGAERDFNFVFFSDASGISEITPVRLPYFQTHGMECEEDRVIVSAFEERFVLDISSHTDIRWTGMAGFDHRNTTNIGRYSPDGKTHTLLLAEGNSRFILQVMHDSELTRHPGGGSTEEIHVLSTLVQQDTAGKIVAEQLLLDLSVSQSYH